ncbi:MAG: hypothetical protein R3264_01545 [Anaerolineae bacterium]|nr:hypothetical protein [Anaerolineae bacterium]
MTKYSVATILIVIFGVVGLIVIIGSLPDHLGCEGQLVRTREVTDGQQIWGERVFSQSFVAPRDRLNRVDLLMHAYGRTNTEAVNIRLLALSPELTNPLEGNEIYRTTINAAEVGDFSWQSFPIPEISDSAGQSYLISLQSPTSTEGNAVAVTGIQKDVYPAGGAFIGPSPAEADMVFRVCFALSTTEKVDVLMTQLTQNRPGLWGSRWFYLVSLAGYVLLPFVLFWQLVRLSLRHQADDPVRRS